MKAIKEIAEYQLEIIQENKFSFGKNEKLIPYLCNKKTFRLHHKNLKLYLVLGFIWKENSGILKLEQAAFFKSYIECNKIAKVNREKGDKIKETKFQIKRQYYIW